MQGIERIEPGARIGEHWVVERVLGEGGMGIVVAAHHASEGRRAAIKILRRGLLDADEARQRFELEARSLGRLRSDHVVRILDAGSLANGTPYLVMEYLEGADLGSVLGKRGPLAIRDAARWVAQAAEGLAEAHAEGIVHRDLKPANLFLERRSDGTERIKVLDFGIAKRLAGGPALTKEGFVLGDPDYMSPEQLQASRTVDAKTDVWALGAILYTLLAGRPPFSGVSLEDRLRAILSGRRTPLSELRPGVPAGLVALVDACLTTDQRARLGSVLDVVERLSPYCGADAQPASGFENEAPPSDPPEPGERAPAPARKLALLLFVLLCLGALVAFLASRAS